MNWHDLETLWHNQAPAPAPSGVDAATLARRFEQRSRREARALLVRDWVEAGTGIFVAVVFGAVAATLGRAAWPVWIAVLLILGVSAFFLRERWRARAARPRPDQALLARVEADIAECSRQRLLLQRVALWYLAPIEIAILIVLGTTISLHPPSSPLREPLALAGILAFQAAIALGVWALNRRAVRRQIEPRLQELEELRRQLAGDPAG